MRSKSAIIATAEAALAGDRLQTSDARRLALDVAALRRRNKGKSLGSTGAQSKTSEQAARNRAGEASVAGKQVKSGLQAFDAMDEKHSVERRAAMERPASSGAAPGIVAASIAENVARGSDRLSVHALRAAPAAHDIADLMDAASAGDTPVAAAPAIGCGRAACDKANRPIDERPAIVILAQAIGRAMPDSRRVEQRGEIERGEVGRPLRSRQ